MYHYIDKGLTFSINNGSRVLMCRIKVSKTQDYLFIEKFSSEYGNVMPEHVTFISLQ
jgi:hypothetical protein